MLNLSIYGISSQWMSCMWLAPLDTLHSLQLPDLHLVGQSSSIGIKEVPEMNKELFVSPHDWLSIKLTAYPDDLQQGKVHLIDTDFARLLRYQIKSSPLGAPKGAK